MPSGVTTIFGSTRNVPLAVRTGTWNLYVPSTFCTQPCWLNPPAGGERLASDRTNPTGASDLTLRMVPCVLGKKMKLRNSPYSSLQLQVIPSAYCVPPWLSENATVGVRPPLVI